MAPVERSVAETSECRPVQGQVSLVLENDTDASELALASGILRYIRSAMNDDIWTLGDVQKVIFMGQRMEGSSPWSPANRGSTSKQNTRDSISQAGKGSLVLATVLGVLGILFIQRRRRRRATQPVLDNGPLEIIKEENESMPDIEHYNSHSSAKCSPAQENNDKHLSVSPDHLADTMVVVEDPVAVEEATKETNLSPSTCRTLDTLSEPAPMTSWIDDDEESHGDGVVLVGDENKELVKSPQKVD